MVPPAPGPVPRQISNGVVQATGFTCSVTTTNTTDDSFSCTGNLAASTSLDGRFDTDPQPMSGMNGQLFGHQTTTDGTAIGGPFAIVGPT